MEPPQRPSSSLFDVFLRLRPSNSASPRFLTVEESERSHPTHITIQPPANSNDKRKRAVERFAFTQVFEEDARQMDLFKGTGIVPMIEGVMGAPEHHGRDGLFATLGCSGSGKVYYILLHVGAGCTNTEAEPYNPRNQDPAWTCSDDAGCHLSDMRRATRTIFLWSTRLLLASDCRYLGCSDVYRNRIFG